MRALFAIGLMLIVTVGTDAQVRAPLAIPAMRAGVTNVPQRTAPLGVLSSSNASSRPLGGVALPTFPGTGIIRRGGGHHVSGASRYVGPVYYSPNAFDTSGYDSYSSYGSGAYSGGAYSDAYGDAPPAEPQRIIVNQYFVSPSGSLSSLNSKQESYQASASAEQPVNPGDPIGPTQNYYLIAYKDHTIYSALAYWVEGETLHYVTTQNTHNQASLALIDLDQTTRLNADRSVPFSVTAK